jgi:hypothetical protein
MQLVESMQRAAKHLFVTAYRTSQRIDAALDRGLDRLSRRALRVTGYGVLGATAVGGVLVVNLLTPAVAAQSAGQAEEIMCQTGAGSAITIAFGLIALLLLIVAGYRGALGLNKLGSSRSDKKREGQSQIKGAGYSLGGVFALIAFPPLLEQVGLATISCVSFAPF